VHHPEAAHLARELGHRAQKPSRPDVVERIGNGVEPDHRDGFEALCGVSRLQGAERHLVVGGEDGINFGVRLQQILRDIVGQGSLPVGGLACNDPDALATTRMPGCSAIPSRNPIRR